MHPFRVHFIYALSCKKAIDMPFRFFYLMLTLKRLTYPLNNEQTVEFF